MDHYIICHQFCYIPDCIYWFIGFILEEGHALVIWGPKPFEAYLGP